MRMNVCRGRWELNCANWHINWKSKILQHPRQRRQTPHCSNVEHLGVACVFIMQVNLARSVVSGPINTYTDIFLWFLASDIHIQIFLKTYLPICFSFLVICQFGNLPIPHMAGLLSPVTTTSWEGWRLTCTSSETGEASQLYLWKSVLINIHEHTDSHNQLAVLLLTVESMTWD